jgi:hypothetical protein
MKLEVGRRKYEGGANHAGEFMRRYSPNGRHTMTPRTTPVRANQAGEFIRRYSPNGRHAMTPRTTPVRANHAGEFIRRYSPNGRHAMTPERQRPHNRPMGAIQ